MLIKITDDILFDSDDIATVQPAASLAKAPDGAAFEFKSDLEVSFKNGQVLRIQAMSPAELYERIEKQKRDSIPAPSPTTDDYNYPAALNDMIKQLEAISNHLHTVSEMFTRFVLKGGR